MSVDLTSWLNSHIGMSLDENTALDSMSYILVREVDSQVVIPIAELGTLVTEYTRAIQVDLAETEIDTDTNEWSRPVNLCLAEDISKLHAIPLRVQLHLRFRRTRAEEPPKTLEQIYNNSFIRALVHAFQQAILSTRVVDHDLRELLCVVSESPVIAGPASSIARLELCFPNCLVSRNSDLNDLYVHAIDTLNDFRVLDMLERRCNDKNWRSIFEMPTPMESRWPLYRSTVRENVTPLSITGYYRSIRSTEVLTPGVDVTLPLESFFDPTQHSYFQQLGVRVPDELHETDRLEDWVWLLLSARWTLRDEITPLKVAEAPDVDWDTNDKIGSDDPIEMARCLLPLIASSTLNKDASWYEIGRVLYNITATNRDVGLAMWIKEGKRCRPPRTEKACSADWNRLDPPRAYLTVKTLAILAQVDSPEDYREWHSRWTTDCCVDALRGTDYAVAVLAYRVFWLDYICTSIKGDIWYSYSKASHRLIQMDRAYLLRKDLSEKLKCRYDSIRSELNVAINESNRSSTGTLKESQQAIDQIRALSEKLESSFFINSVVKTAAGMFYVPNFEQIVDSDTFITGWSNCVIEICGNRAAPRPGRLEDFVTRGGGVPYEPSYDFEHPNVVGLMTYLSQVFPDQDMLNYMLRDFASFLYGNNAEKLFRFWYGDGDNSKSMLIKLIESWLGSYVVNLPISVISAGQRKGSGPTPELAQLKGARVAIIAEPDNTDDLKAGMIKSIAGKDSFYARNNYSDGGKIENKTIVIYVCNAVGSIPGVDNATKRRCRFHPFLSTWVDDAPEDPDEQILQLRFPKNDKFDDELRPMAHAMLWLAVEWYPTYARDGLFPAEIMQAAADNHWAFSDVYSSFINNQLQPVRVDEGEPLTAANSFTTEDVWTQFQPFYRDAYPQAQMISRSYFIAQISSRIGAMVNFRWKGFVPRRVEVRIAPSPRAPMATRT